MQKTKRNMDVSEYEFQRFSSSSSTSDDEVQNYEFQGLEGLTVEQAEKHDSVIRIERKKADDNNFKISSFVEEHRGIQEQSFQEREDRIEQEVQLRLSKIQEEAYAEGFNKGVEEGKEEVYQQTKAESEEKIVALSEIVNEVLSAKVDIFKAEKNGIYEMVRNLSRWVILREIEEDERYLERLLEKLILEMQSKSNLLVQVNRDSFEKMPEILEHVENKIGKLTNVRIETDYKMEGPGVILSSDNGIINGSLKEQFKSLDRLFETVGLTPIQEEDVFTLEKEPEIDDSDGDGDDGGS